MRASQHGRWLSKSGQSGKCPFPEQIYFFTTMPNYKQLCVELLLELENAIRVVHLVSDGTRHISSAYPVINMVKNALATPEPEAPRQPPVPVSERWPEFSDCDRWERVWCWNWRVGAWRLSRIDQEDHSHWLPVHALPVPSYD